MADDDEPVWGGRGPDPWLPDRLAAFLDAARAEARMFRAFLAHLRDWLALVRDRTRQARYDPSVIPALIPAWWDAMTEFTEQHIVPTMEQGYQAVTGQGFTVDSRALAVARAMLRRNALARVADEVYTRVKTQVAKAVHTGTSGVDLAAIIEGIFDTTATPYWANRATVIARTETIGALNGGRYDGHMAVAGRLGGAFERIWVSTLDTRTRPTHVAAEGQRAPLDGTFAVGDGHLRFPGDPAGPPEEVIQCRCTTLLVRPGQNVNIARRA